MIVIWASASASTVLQANSLGILETNSASIKSNYSSTAYENDRRFPFSVSFNALATIKLSSASEQSDSERKQENKGSVYLAEWLEQALNPIYQFVRKLRQPYVEDQAQEEDENGTANSLTAINETPSERLNKAVEAATKRYEGVLLSVKKLAMDQATYRIKILRDSGELRTLDYSEEEDAFVSEGEVSWYANTVD